MEPLELAIHLLQSESTAAVSTTDEAGSPYVAPVFYLSGERLRLYWFSSSSSQHSRNLKRNPSAAVCVYRPTDQWKQICGIQMRGRAAAVTDRRLRKSITSVYVERFALGPTFGPLISRTRLYEFRPAWLRYLDNRRRFGYKFELLLED